MVVCPLGFIPWIFAVIRVADNSSSSLGLGLSGLGVFVCSSVFGLAGIGIAGAGPLLAAAVEFFEACLKKEEIPHSPQ